MTETNELLPFSDIYVLKPGFTKSDIEAAIETRLSKAQALTRIIGACNWDNDIKDEESANFHWALNDFLKEIQYLMTIKPSS